MTHILSAVLALSPTLLRAADNDSLQSAIRDPRPTIRRTLFLGLGRNHLYDSYLSPLNYTGEALSLTHLSEGQPFPTRHPRRTSLRLVSLRATRADNPTRSARYWDGELELAYGWYHPLTKPQAPSSTQCSLGALLNLHLGGTYSTRNGNNPAQGRAALDLTLSAQAKGDFRLFRRSWPWRCRLFVPLTGVMFTPRYGQSYYEIFELHHTNHNLRLTHPFNAPSARLLADLTLPFAPRFSLGFDLDVRQSSVAGLRRHAWHTALVVGYSRTLQFLR